MQHLKPITGLTLPLRQPYYAFPLCSTSRNPNSNSMFCIDPTWFRCDCPFIRARGQSKCGRRSLFLFFVCFDIRSFSSATNYHFASSTPHPSSSRLQTPIRTWTKVRPAQKAPESAHVVSSSSRSLLLRPYVSLRSVSFRARLNMRAPSGVEL